MASISNFTVDSGNGLARAKITPDNGETIGVVELQHEQGGNFNFIGQMAFNAATGFYEHQGQYVQGDTYRVNAEVRYEIADTTTAT